MRDPSLDLSNDMSWIELLLNEQTDILQMAAQGKPLPDVLQHVISWVETKSSNPLAAYINYHDHEENLSARHLNLCWSKQLTNKDGTLRGSFGVYSDTPCILSDRDLQLLSFAAHTALLAIEFGVVERVRLASADRETAMAENTKKSEQRFQNLVREATIGIVVLRGEEMVVDVVNEMYGKLIKRTPEQLLGRPLFEVIPDAEDPFRPLLDEVRISGKALSLHDQPYHVMVEGKDIHGYLNIIYQPFREFDGTLTGVMALCHDVTEVVEVRRQLERSEAELRNLVESAPFPIGVYTGKEMRIELANQSMKDVWGKGNDVVGKLYTEILPELENQQIFQQLATVYKTGKPFHAKNKQVDILAGDVIQTFYFNYSFTPVFDHKQKIYGVMNTAADVTELALANKRLEESEVRARLAIEASGQGSFHINLKTNEMLASERMAEIYCLRVDADRNEYVSSLHPDDRRVREKAMKEAFKTSILEYEGRVSKSDGLINWVRVYGKVYFDHDKKPERLVGVVQDITAQKKFASMLAEKVEERTAELEVANRQLLAINDELQQFAYVASHDLQEPLRKIRIFSDMLSKEMDAAAPSLKFIEKITSAATRMSGLIQSLLEYSRVANAKARFQPVDIQVIINNILTDYELMIIQKNAIISVHKLPVIEGVPLQINQLFFNLLGNALKFTKRGVQPVITISAAPPDEKLFAQFPELNKDKTYTAITIEDNGIGFDTAFASKIFTVFQQLNERSSYGGYGIGLALCKKVVQTHDGIIYAESELKRGSRFTIVSPVKQQ
jgi:PAS domain S-box-containing protein